MPDCQPGLKECLLVERLLTERWLAGCRLPGCNDRRGWNGLGARLIAGTQR